MEHEDAKKGRLSGWIKGQLHWKAEQAMDQRAQTDPFLQDALEGLRSFPEHDHEKSIDRLQNQLAPKTQSRIIPIFWRRIAAVFILALGISSIWLLNRPSSTKADLSMESVDNTEPMDNSRFRAPTAADEQTEEEIKEILDPTIVAPSPAPILPPLEEETYSNYEDQISSTEADQEVSSFNPPPPPLTKADEGGAALKNRPSTSARKEERPVEYAVEEEALTEVRAAIPVETLPEVSIKTLVSGTVIDPQGLPVAGATVEDKNSQQSVLTNTQGNFTLQVTPSGQAVELSVNHFNYQDTVLQIQESSLANIQLADRQNRTDFISTDQDLLQQPYPEGGFTLFMENFQPILLEKASSKRDRSRKKRKALAEAASNETVTLVFTVFQDGHLADIKPLNSPNPNEDKILEVIKMLENGPRWVIPAQQDSVRTQITLPLNR